MNTTFKMFAGTLMLATALASFKSPALPSEFADSTSSIKSGSEAVANSPLVMNGIYKFTDPAAIMPKVEFINGVRTVTPENYTISFSRNEPVAVEFLANGDVKIKALLPEGEAGEIPEAMIISAEEFDKSGLRFSEEGGYKELYAKHSNDEEYKEARRGRGGFRRSGRMHIRNAAGGSYFGCVASVCSSIGGCVGSVGNGVGMTRYLRARGWHPVSCSNPPVGAVASWSGGSGAGHTGRWNGSGWCYDKGCGDPGSRYRLLNCVAR